eukprot:3845394-Prymnesium_polylepis.1
MAGRVDVVEGPFDSRRAPYYTRARARVPHLPVVFATRGPNEPDARVARPQKDLLDAARVRRADLVARAIVKIHRRLRRTGGRPTM